MIIYTYSILRYIPDIVSEEFINVGVVLYDNTNKNISVRMINNCDKLLQRFGHIDIDSDFLLSQLNYIDLALYKVDLTPNLKFNLFKVLPKDDSSLQFSDISSGVTTRTLEEETNNIFSRYIK